MSNFIVLSSECNDVVNGFGRHDQIQEKYIDSNNLKAKSFSVVSRPKGDQPWSLMFYRRTQELASVGNRRISRGIIFVEGFCSENRVG